MATTYNIKITCETEGAEIHYETSGSADTAPSDVTKSSPLYSSEFGLSVSDGGAQISAKAFKNGMEDSDVAIKTIKPVTVPMALPDGSVLFYDRGSTYGEYVIGDDGYPIRLSSGEDDGSAESTYWRYLICDQHDLDNGKFRWGPYGTNEGMTDAKYEDMGYGLPNTNAMIVKYATDTLYWWKLIKEKRDNTGLNWFMPSRDELDMMYDNRSVISSEGGVALQSTPYWSSSEYSSYSAWYQSFSSGSQNYNRKNNSGHCRLLRRI